MHERDYNKQNTPAHTTPGSKTRYCFFSSASSGRSKPGCRLLSLLLIDVLLLLAIPIAHFSLLLVLTLKKAVTQYPILHQFDPQRRIVLCTNAIAFAIGGVLWQRYGEDPLPMTYGSRRLKNMNSTIRFKSLDTLP